MSKKRKRSTITLEDTQSHLKRRLIPREETHDPLVSWSTYSFVSPLVFCSVVFHLMLLR